MHCWMEIMGVVGLYIFFNKYYFWFRMFFWTFLSGCLGGGWGVKIKIVCSIFFSVTGGRHYFYIYLLFLYAKNMRGGEIYLVFYIFSHAKNMSEVCVKCFIFIPPNATNMKGSGIIYAYFFHKWVGVCVWSVHWCNLSRPVHTSVFV